MIVMTRELLLKAVELVEHAKEHNEMNAGTFEPNMSKEEFEEIVVFIRKIAQYDFELMSTINMLEMRRKLMI